MSQTLISIVVPVYNAAKFLDDTISNVQNQTYSNWELLLIDDCSTDGSVKIINEYKKFDKRIKLLQMKKNSGAGESRNAGTAKAKGEYLAFLDADDLWVNTKLDKQISFMKANGYDFTFTSYEFSDSNGIPSGKRVIVPAELSYKDALKRSSISTITVMINLNAIPKKAIMMPNFSIGEETATWWRILREYHNAHGMIDVLSYYRRGAGDTLSSNKFRAMRYRWFLYREHENLSRCRSLIYFLHYANYAVRRRI